MADGEDLFEVMAGVNEVEPPPLGDGEWAEDMVTERTPASKEGFCQVGKLIEAGELSMDGLDEFMAREGLGG